MRVEPEARGGDLALGVHASKNRQAGVHVVIDLDPRLADDRLDALVWGLSELNLAGSDLDLPGVIDFADGMWVCQCCRNRYSWGAGRPCPKCREPAPSTYDEPVDPDAPCSG
jgi:hypothetical protein